MSNAGPADLGPVTLPPNGVENFPSYDDEDLSNILPTTGGRLESCSTAEVMSEETTTWEDEGGRVHFSIRFPDWVQGTRVSVDLGTGITSLESCWNVAQHPAANLATGGNGQPLVVFTLGHPSPNLAVGCMLSGTWTNAHALIVYDGSVCKPPLPPGPPDLRFWLPCASDWADADTLASDEVVPPPPPPPPPIRACQSEGTCNSYEYHLLSVSPTGFHAQIYAQDWTYPGYQVRLDFARPVAVTSLVGARLEQWTNATGNEDKEGEAAMLGHNDHKPPLPVPSTSHVFTLESPFYCQLPSGGDRHQRGLDWSNVQAIFVPEGASSAAPGEKLGEGSYGARQEASIGSPTEHATEPKPTLHPMPSLGDHALTWKMHHTAGGGCFDVHFSGAGGAAKFALPIGIQCPWFAPPPPGPSPTPKSPPPRTPPVLPPPLSPMPAPPDPSPPPPSEPSAEYLQKTTSVVKLSAAEEVIVARAFSFVDTPTANVAATTWSSWSSDAILASNTVEEATANSMPPSSLPGFKDDGPPAPLIIADGASAAPASPATSAPLTGAGGAHAGSGRLVVGDGVGAVTTPLVAVLAFSGIASLLRGCTRPRKYTRAATVSIVDDDDEDLQKPSSDC